MTMPELDEIVRELYVLPPTDFVAVRNELVRQARAAGSRELADRLQRLRRPTRSAWLVNLLAQDPVAMHRLSAMGRQLREAQTGLHGSELRNLTEQRRQLITDLLHRARRHAAEAGLRLTDGVLSEVEATLQAALVDLAGALTVRNGRLVRPLSHNGFGPRPHVDLGPAASPEEWTVVKKAADWDLPPVDDELAARRRRASADGRVPERVDLTDAELVQDDASSAPDPRTETVRDLRRAEEELAFAEFAHWQREYELADAVAAVEAADDKMSSLAGQRMEARRDKVTAQAHLSEARARQHEAVNALADARRRLDLARRMAGKEG
ncbi:MAG TPA: hypothetical protein VFR13_10320 [Jiangellaceae bacterium]|nr:hypothetical protein [Jiangellaceae bacterium]